MLTFHDFGLRPRYWLNQTRVVEVVVVMWSGKSCGLAIFQEEGRGFGRER